MRTSSTSWWREQHSSAGAENQVKWALHCLVWAREKVITDLATELDSAVALATYPQFSNLLATVNVGREVSQPQPAVTVTNKLYRDHFRIVYILARRGNMSAKTTIMRNARRDLSEIPVWAHGTLLSWLSGARKGELSQREWTNLIDDFIRVAPSAGWGAPVAWDAAGPRLASESKMSVRQARRVLDHPLLMPRWVIDLAVSRLAATISAPAPLADVARSGGWNVGPTGGVD